MQHEMQLLMMCRVEHLQQSPNNWYWDKTFSDLLEELLPTTLLGKDERSLYLRGVGVKYWDKPKNIEKRDWRSIGGLLENVFSPIQ